MTKPSAATRHLVRRLRAVIRAADAAAADPASTADDVASAAWVVDATVPLLAYLDRKEGSFFARQETRTAQVAKPHPRLTLVASSAPSLAA